MSSSPFDQDEAVAGNFHQCDEWVDITSLVPCAKVILATALAFLQGPG